MDKKSCGLYPYMFLQDDSIAFNMILTYVGSKKPVSYTHLDVYKRQELARFHGQGNSFLGDFFLHSASLLGRAVYKRQKVISTFAPGFGGKLTSGIYAANSHKVLPVESCLLQDEALDKTMQAVRAAANACRYQPYDEDKGTGLVRHCLLRRGVATGQVMVAVSYTHLDVYKRQAPSTLSCSR